MTSVSSFRTRGIMQLELLLTCCACVAHCGVPSVKLCQCDAVGSGDAWTGISSFYEVESLARVCHAGLDRCWGHHTITCCYRCLGSRASATGGKTIVVLNTVGVSCDMCAGACQGRVLNILSQQILIVTCVKGIGCGLT